MTGVPLSVDLIGRLKTAFPGVVAGVKDSSGEWQNTEKLLAAHGDLQILVGDERQLARAVRQGGAGTICGLANLMPGVVRKAAHDGVDDPRIADAVQAIMRYPFMPAVKALIAHRRGDAGWRVMAPPLTRWRMPTRSGSSRISRASRPRRPRDGARMPGSQALKLREKAYRSFTRHLLARDIRPGQFISQRELVALTGQPLGAIRELIPRLEAEGLIVTVPQRGMQVAHVDLNLIRNAFQFRLLMEREAVAAFTRDAGNDAVAALREAHEAIIARGAQRRRRAADRRRAECRSRLPREADRSPRQ